MRLLLDTHIWFRAIVAPKRLPRRVASALDKSTNELWLSPVSMWELLLLSRRGRLNLRPDPVRWIESHLSEAPMQEAPVTRQVALATRGVWLPHSDPADLLLAATAKVYDLTLVTADEQLLSGTGFPLFNLK